MSKSEQLMVSEFLPFVNLGKYLELKRKGLIERSRQFEIDDVRYFTVPSYFNGKYVVSYKRERVSMEIFDRGKNGTVIALYTREESEPFEDGWVEELVKNLHANIYEIVENVDNGIYSGDIHTSKPKDLCIWENNTYKIILNTQVKHGR